MTHIQCNKHFQSQWCYIKNKPIEIEEYLQNENKYKNETIKCNNNHELILANGKKVKPYFRHKFDGDVDDHHMTLWHSEWQGHFPKTEIDFKKKNSDQVKNRRADVCLNEKTNIELQHSIISKEEIDNRKKDYELHKKDIIWIIHGNESNINIVKRNDGSTYLEFTSDHWKHESFTSYNSIYIDINENIYKINPNKVKSYMTDVENSIEKYKFIDSLKDNINLWSNDEPSQFKLFIKQQGAGNGKTYGIIQMLEDDKMLHYKNFIFISKQHSAKSVINNEFKDQIKNNQIPCITDLNEKEVNKKYIKSYTNTKNNTEHQMIIATIDSLMYSIGDKNSTGYDKFENIVNSIIEDHIHTKDKSGTIKYATVDPKLNKETLLIVDEAQDLTKNYADAIINIMKHKYIDAYIVGDKIQSISNDPNSFTYLSDTDFLDITIIKLPPTNICRRFIDSKLIDFVNSIVPFAKYDLPPITPYKICEINDPRSLNFFTGKTVYSEDSDDKINSEIEEIMIHFKNEVEEKNRSPKDFLIITPFTSCNPLVDALQLAIDVYWKDKIGSTTDEYTRYSVFHKSEEGTSINLDESENSTRIVSIHSSKGDGRPVVFVIGMTEGGLKKFSNQKKDNLIYDSLVHVAFTRMKERLYIRYENNMDDIAQKINKYNHRNNIEDSIKPDFYISNSIKYRDLIRDCSKESFDEFKKTIINNANIDRFEDSKDEKRIIDMGNHLIRFASLFINIQIEIMNKEIKNKDKEVTKQIIAKWHAIAESYIEPVYDWKKYNNLTSKYKLSVMSLSKKGRDYKNYYNIIHENMKNIKEKIKNLSNIPVLCPFECVILHFMIQISHNGIYTDTNINDIYNIVDVYNNSFDSLSDGHDNCLCKQKFINNTNIVNTNIKKMKEYLHNHFDKVKDIKNTMYLFHEKYPKINWLIDHTIAYNGYNDNYRISQKCQLIGYDDNIVILGYVKPQFNQLNFNEVLMNSIFDTYLITNVKKEDTNKNYQRFNGKKVISVVFTLDQKEPYYIDWDNYITNELIKNVIYEYLKNEYITENNSVYYFYKYWRNNYNESDFINFLKDEYVKIKNYYTGKLSFPSYIDEFLTRMQLKIELDKKKKKIILNEYDDKDYFMTELEDILCSSLKRYLGIKDEESDEETNLNT